MEEAHWYIPIQKHDGIHIIESEMLRKNWIDKVFPRKSTIVNWL